jgi:PAS domain S-box-containing protein
VGIWTTSLAILTPKPVLGLFRYAMKFSPDNNNIYCIFTFSLDQVLHNLTTLRESMSQESNSRFVNKVLLRQSIGSVRLVVALFTVTAAVTKLLYNRFLPELNDLDAVRWTIIGLGCVFLVSTYFPYKRRVVVSYFSLFLYLSTLLYVITFVVINGFNPNAVTILILVLGASSVIFNSLVYYGIQCFIIILASAFSFSASSLPSENLVAFLNLLIALGVFAIVITVRLKLLSSVRNSHATLEKLNVLSIVANKSGEIVFISPSVYSILGYQPTELMKDGWWKATNLKDGWISRDYILNYPNILPREIASIETSLLNKDGKRVWFNWVNSVLPNGSYVGVALDITKFKKEHIPA